MQIQIANTIRERRKQLGWSQEKLAEQLGVSAQAVSKWETATSYPDITLLPKLEEILSITLEQLFYGVAMHASASAPSAENMARYGLPDDDIVRIIQFLGNTPLARTEACAEIDTPPIPLAVPPHENSINVHIWGNASINGTVNGPIHAGNNIQCGTVNGSASCGAALTCNTVNGCVTASTSTHQSEKTCPDTENNTVNT